jgi:hypothetical protein
MQKDVVMKTQQKTYPKDLKRIGGEATESWCYVNANGSIDVAVYVSKTPGTGVVTVPVSIVREALGVAAAVDIAKALKKLTSGMKKKKAKA